MCGARRPAWPPPSVRHYPCQAGAVRPLPAHTCPRPRPHSPDLSSRAVRVAGCWAPGRAPLWPRPPDTIAPGLTHRRPFASYPHRRSQRTSCCAWRPTAAARCWAGRSSSWPRCASRRLLSLTVVSQRSQGGGRLQQEEGRPAAARLDRLHARAGVCACCTTAGLLGGARARGRQPLPSEANLPARVRVCVCAHFRTAAPPQGHSQTRPQGS